MLRPGAELEAEARISVRTDPYLADYLLDGEAVLPAAIALEAMAQAASALGGQPARSARRVRFGAPVAIPAGDAHDGGAGRETVLRIWARAGADGVETVLRAGTGGQLAECARAVFVGSGDAATPPAHADGAARSGPAVHPGAGGHPGAEGYPGAAVHPGLGGRSGAAFPAGAEIVDGADLYGSVCFQTGRFCRVALVAGKPPRSCRAIVRGRDEAAWFGPLPRPAGRLVLGSPGLNDAALQVAQACVPQRRLLPGGCDSLTVTGDQVPGAMELRAFLISAAPGAGEYVWDVHGYDQDGQLVMAWIGLRMRDAGPLPDSSGRCSSGRWPPGRCSPADADLFLPDAQAAGVAAQLEAVRPAAVPQQQVESLSRAR
jgi:Polyketide synthase dehydratase